jgi:opine dehydrogenase
MSENMKEKIAICGAGQGGHAMAAHLSMMGNYVTVYTHTPNKAESIEQKGNTITVSGKLEGEILLQGGVTTNLIDSIKDKDYIFIVTDATVHKYFAQNLAPYLSNQNVILISPGVGGAMEFAHEVRKVNSNEKITVSETDTLMYACKVPEIGSSYIKEIKQSILYATVPTKGKTIDDFIQTAYPFFENAGDPLMGLDDSPVFHIVGMLKNSKRILNEEDFNFYIDGITPEYADYMVSMDKERCEVASAVGLKPRTVREWLNIAYGVEMDSLYNMIQNTQPYQNTPTIPNRSPAPKTLYHRYVLEEIPLRAVPTVEIAKIFGIQTPKYEEMINKACEITGVDFWKTGRTIHDMGITEKDLFSWKDTYHRG